MKIGAKVARHGRYVTFQLAEVAVPRHLFANVRWSSEFALRDALVNVKNYGLIDELVDVDCAADLALLA